jgi:hypothetical protein
MRHLAGQPLTLVGAGNRRTFGPYAIPDDEHRVIVRCARKHAAAPALTPEGTYGYVYAEVSYDGGVTWGEGSQGLVGVGLPGGVVRRERDGAELPETTATMRLRAGMGRLARVRIDTHLDRVVTRVTLDTEPGEPWSVVPQAHNSVAFGQASDGQATATNSITISHTAASGTETCVFAGGASSDSPVANVSGITYGGAAMTAVYDNTAGFFRSVGYRKTAPAPGAQNCVMTLTGADSELALGCISMTGVDQSTPTGASVPFTSWDKNQTSVSVTVTGVAADDLVIDTLYGTYATATVGADQTLRNTETVNSATDFRMSTQPGTAGGVMAWSVSGERYGINPALTLSACVFKAATGGPTFQAAWARGSNVLIGRGA